MLRDAIPILYHWTTTLIMCSCRCFCCSPACASMPAPALSDPDTCDVCIHRYDHHCVWTNCCIGGLNLRLFSWLPSLSCAASVSTHPGWLSNRWVTWSPLYSHPNGQRYCRLGGDINAGAHQRHGFGLGWLAPNWREVLLPHDPTLVATAVYGSSSSAAASLVEPVFRLLNGAK
uniref:Palmitoyltransferase n=1 Tax=Macrostomum lignano TaxID=282301 RepID=A0A1I8F8Z0_9PLAT